MTRLRQHVSTLRSIGALDMPLTDLATNLVWSATRLANANDAWSSSDEDDYLARQKAVNDTMDQSIVRYRAQQEQAQ
jgi:hypothetical protein